MSTHPFLYAMMSPTYKSRYNNKAKLNAHNKINRTKGNTFLKEHQIPLLAIQ